MKPGEEGILQLDPRLLLEGLEGFKVVVLPKVLQAQPDGLCFPAGRIESASKRNSETEK